MSFWSYINGTVNVCPMGRTQAEKRYILDTVLEHLPVVHGSERDMNIYVIQPTGYEGRSSCDEFGQTTNNLRNRYGEKSRDGWLTTQSKYILVVDASLRDKMFQETYREFQKWLCRLAKRVDVCDVLVEVKGYDKGWRSEIIQSKDEAYARLFEEPTWFQYDPDGEPNWCEYLMWERAKNSDYPLLLGYKYFADEGNDAEVERRFGLRRGHN